MRINLPLDYIIGHLRSGHLESEVNFTEEEEKEFKDLLEIDIAQSRDLTNEEYDKLDEYKERIIDNCEIFVDDYELDDWGGPYWGDLL